MSSQKKFVQETYFMPYRKKNQICCIKKINNCEFWKIFTCKTKTYNSLFANCFLKPF